MHRPEDQVGADECNPEMDIGQCVVEVTSKHLREPVVNTGKHAKEGCNTHYNVEVGDHKIGIMQVNIQC